MLPNSNTLLEILKCILSDMSVVVIGPPSQSDMTQTNQMSLISSVVNCLKLLIYPLTWVQTCITIVPYELVDILDAPMPYIVGILCNLWNEFVENCQDSSFLDDKCIITISQNNTLSVQSRFSDGYQDADKFTPYLITKQSKIVLEALL